MLDHILPKLLIVALSSVTGVSAQITVKPASAVVIWDTPAEFNCTSTGSSPGWTYADYTADAHNSPLAEEGCNYTRRFGPEQLRLDRGGVADRGVCNLALLKPNLTAARKFTCKSSKYRNSGVLLGIGPELTCDSDGVSRLTCALNHSRYGDLVTTVPRLLVSLVWTDPGGHGMVVDSSESTAAEAVGAVDLPDGATLDHSRPYTCSVEFKWDRPVTEEFSGEIRGPTTELECYYPELDPAKAIDRTRQTSGASASKWDSSVDGIKTVLMMIKVSLWFFLLSADALIQWIQFGERR